MPSTENQTTGVTNLQLMLENAIQRHHVAGASLAVFQNGKLTTAAAGVANAATGIEMTSDTLLHAHSITKVFTVTLIMQLVDEGLLELDDPVLRYLPDLKLKDSKALERITVKMLLNHTSGIDSDMLPEYGHDGETIEKAIFRFSELDQIHEPGADCSYSNGALVIAGYLAQRISGKSWYDLVKEKIFVPLDMENSAVLPEAALLQRCSVGHYFNPSTGNIKRSEAAFMPLSFSPSGSSLMLSAGDLITFARMHINDGVAQNGNRVLSEQSAKAMRKITVNNPPLHNVNGVGLGWLVFNNDVVGHSGGGAGNVSMLYVYPEKKFALAILVNTNNGATLIKGLTKPLIKEIADIPLYGDYDDLCQGEKDVVVDAKRYVGIYENVSTRYKITVRPGGLGLSVQGKFKMNDGSPTTPSSVVPLFPIGTDHFLLSPVGDSSSFQIAPISFRSIEAGGFARYLVSKGRFYQRRPIDEHG